MSERELLLRGLETLELLLNETAVNQLLDYLSLLAKWNRVYNLTSVQTLAEQVTKHVLDSLSVLHYLRGSHVLDVGTGAGLPGLLLAIANPERQYTLLDSNAKKTRFVQQVILELKIANSVVICQRIEHFNPSCKFDTVISRAFASLTDFYLATRHLCRPGGQLLAMKGIYPKEEIADLAKLPVHLDSVPLQVPQLTAQRHLIIISDEKFQRQETPQLAA